MRYTSIASIQSAAGGWVLNQIGRRAGNAWRRFPGATAWFLAGAMFFSFIAGSIAAGQPERERKIFAHHMGSLNAGTGAMRHHINNANLDLGDPDSSNGGNYRNWPLAPYRKNLGTLGAADLDIRRALRIGIDGFAINAWAGGHQNHEFLDALFEVAEEKGYPFEITLSLDPATLGGGANLTDPDGNPYPESGPYGASYQRAVNAIQYLLDRYGDSPNLARRDGKPLIFGYMSGYIGIHYARAKYPDKSDNEIRSNSWGWEAIGEGIRELENQVGEPLYLHFCMQSLFHGVWTRQRTLYADAAGAIAKHVDAVGEFLPAFMEHAGATPNSQLLEAARRVSARGKEWSHPVFFQYENARNNVAYPVKGTDAFKNLWAAAREHSTLIQYTTWNDYHEASNLAPGYDTRYAIFDLAGYYIDWWKNGEPPQAEGDKVYIFSRKYPSNAKVFPFRNQRFVDGAIEVVTILSEPAIVHLPGRGTYEAPAGYFSKQISVTPGPVAAELWRNGKLELRLDHPEPVTERPFRQDNGITAISTEFMRHWVADFGEDEPPLIYSEYGDADGDGLPNWFEMYWFGKFLDMSTATAADATEDLNGSGMTNLEEYLLQRNPLAAEPEPASGADTDDDLIPGYRGRSFHGEPAPIPGRIQAQDFDRGGNHVAYYETIWLNQGLHYRRENSGDSVDIGPNSWHPDPEGGDFHVGWTRPGEWMNYTVEVEEDGYYDVHIRHASGGSDGDGGFVSVTFDGRNLTGVVDLPFTGSWKNWRTTVVNHIPLKAGVQVMRVRIEGNAFGGGCNLNFFEVVPSGSTRPKDIEIESKGTWQTIASGEKLKIQAIPPSNNISRLYLKVNGDVVGETSGPQWRMEWEATDPGDHTIQVEAIGFPGGYHHSEVKTVVVAEAQASIEYPISFAEWQDIFFSEEGLYGSQSGPMDDPDGDGVPNLLEYALGGHPNESGSALLPISVIDSIGDEKFLTFSFNRPYGIIDLVYEIQVSTDLQGWIPIEPERYEITVHGDWETVTVRTPIAGPWPMMYKRLKVWPMFGND